MAPLKPDLNLGGTRVHKHCTKMKLHRDMRAESPPCQSPRKRHHTPWDSCSMPRTLPAPPRDDILHWRRPAIVVGPAGRASPDEGRTKVCTEQRQRPSWPWQPWP